MPIHTPQGARVFVDGVEITDHWQPNGHWEGPDAATYPMEFTFTAVLTPAHKKSWRTFIRTLIRTGRPPRRRHRITASRYIRKGGVRK